VDLLPPLLLLGVGFLLLPTWATVWARTPVAGRLRKLLPVAGVLVALLLLGWTFTRFPIARWDPEVYAQSPITYSLALSQGTLQTPEPALFDQISPLLAILGTLVGGMLLAWGLSGWSNQASVAGTTRFRRGNLLAALLLAIVALVIFFTNNALTEWLFELNTSWRFLIAMIVATGTGTLIGALLETALIRPLYDRPIYQIMVTLGVSFIVIELVRAIWGRPEFTMPKPAFANATGAGCPATSIGDMLANQCSTILLFDGRIRTYNEVFIILIGLIVLVGVYLLIQRTRLGMIIRAGVQDSEMVEALGINVRRVFTLVFAVGVGLAALGGVLAAPSIGLSVEMGTRLLLLALIALAIGGLTSYPGAAAGAVLVGLLQQFIIKYGSIGINIPFVEEPFKPSPPLVPASTILLMVVILLVLPQGLFGRDE
jgi:branched-chain amino acid transport system permease protein